MEILKFIIRSFSLRLNSSLDLLVSPWMILLMSARDGQVNLVSGSPVSLTYTYPSPK